MIETKTLITFYHEEKIAKKKILNKDNSIIVNNKKQILENLNFEYSFFELNNDKLEKISDDGKIGNYYLK